MSLLDKDRLTRAPRWLWLTLGGSVAAALVVAIAVAIRPAVDEKVMAANAPNSVPIENRESPPAEADQPAAVVSYPRQPGNTYGRDGGDVGTDPPSESRSPTTPDVTAPVTAVPSDGSAAVEPNLPPRADAARAVGALASLKPKSAIESATDPDDPKAQTPPKPPSVEADRPPEPPRGPDPTYMPARLSTDAAAISFEQSIRELLELGWNAKATGLRQAEEKFKAANDRCPDDPRASYAYGLVLLKHNQYDEAMKQFDSVGENGKPPYLPAFRAAIWLRFLRKSYEPATLDLVNLTRAWQAVEPGPLPDWVQSEFVAWTGQMIGFLEGPVDNRSVDALCKQAIADLEAILTLSHRELLNESRNDVLDSFAAKASAQDKARLGAKREQEKEAEATKARLTAEAAETKQEKKQVEKSAEELERSLKAELGAIDAQINGLAREYDRLDLRARNIANYVRSLDADIASLINQRTQLQAEQNAPPPTKDSDTKKTGAPKTPPPQPINNTAQILAINIAIDQRNRDRLRYQADYDRLEIQARDVQRQGNVLLNRRQSLINEYQTTTGKLYKEKETLAAREKFLERRKKEIAKPATGSTGQVKALGQTAKALRTYVDFNLELEKERLLDSLAKP